MTIIPPFFLNSVVSIGIKSNDPEQALFWIGTGFFVGRKERNDKYQIYLITNKHVLANHEELYLKCNSSDGTNPKDYRLETGIKSKKLTYTPHPQPDIDICATHINSDVLIENNAELNFFALDKHSLTLDKMKETGVSEGSLVYALGFPMNLVSDKKKTPICRLGCISRISDLYVDKSNKQYIVDAEVFPGNSGGPIINYPENFSIEGTPSNPSANLIGILNSNILYGDRLISLQSGDVKSIQTENSGLTKVFPVDYIVETVELERKRVYGDNA